jgi:phage terminase large subunit
MIDAIDTLPKTEIRPVTPLPEGGMEVIIPAAFYELFLPSRYKAYWGGRGGAKSHSFAAVLLMLAKETKLRILCCREIQNSIKDSVKKLLEDKIEAYHWGNFFVSTRDMIVGANGSVFLFEGLRHNIGSIKSMEAIDICWVEEAQSVSVSSLEVLIPTIRKKGSEIWFSWNPKNPEDAVDDMFRGNFSGGDDFVPPPRSFVREVHFEHNPWFSEELRAEMEYDKLRDPDKYLHVWRGHYETNSESRVFKNWRIGEEEDFEAYSMPEDDFTEPGQTPIDRYYFGADWGYANDPTVLVQVFIDGNKLFVRREAYKVGCEIDNTPD